MNPEAASKAVAGVKVMVAIFPSTRPSSALLVVIAASVIYPPSISKLSESIT
jgi:hypothetical protein